MNTKEYLINELHRYVKENGEIPRRNDIRYNKDYPSDNSYQKEFGSFTKALEISKLKLKINDNFFNPNNITLEGLYIVGLMIADGNIYNNVFSISLVDIETICEMHKVLNLDTNIQLFHGVKTSAKIVKTNRQWIKDLSLYGIIPDKHLKTFLPLKYCKTEQEIAALCLGLFDGDGSIVINKNKYASFEMAGSYDLCNQYSKILKNIGVTKEIKIEQKDCCIIRTARKKDIKIIYDFLYQNKSLSKLWISRKYNRWSKLLDKTFKSEDYYNEYR